MAMKTALAVVGTGALLTLQGCGSDGPSPAPGPPNAGPSPPAPGPPPAPDPGPNPAPAPAPAPPTTVVTTTTLAPNPTAPLAGADVAAIMNQEFTSFNKDNEQGSMGAIIRITGDMMVYCDEGCYQGYADCRVSASVYNPTQIVSSDGTIEWSYTGTGTDGDFLGIYINQTLTRQHIGKCSYIGDGGTDNKYNMGCGKKAPCTSNSCDDNTCAFANMDPDTNFETPLTKDSDAVKNAVIGDGCNDPGVCGYKGPAWWKQDGYVPDEMFKAFQWRAEYAPNTADWNEIILDGEELKKALNYNPAGTFPAVVYASTFPGGLEAGKTAARAMAQKMADDYNMPTPVPIVKIDLSVNVVNGGSPFVFEDTASEELTV